MCVFVEGVPHAMCWLHGCFSSRLGHTLPLPLCEVTIARVRARVPEHMVVHADHTLQGPTSQSTSTWSNLTNTRAMTPEGTQRANDL